MKHAIITGERVTNQLARALEASLRADTYAVLHLNREVDGIRGDRQIYAAETVKFMERLAKLVRGTRNYRSMPAGKRFLANAITIEKLYDGPHLNIMIRKPSHWSDERFREAMVETWQVSPWAACDANAVYIEPRISGSRLVGYCHKEGDEALVVETLSF